MNFFIWLLKKSRILLLNQCPSTTNIHPYCAPSGKSHGHGKCRLNLAYCGFGGLYIILEVLQKTSRKLTKEMKLGSIQQMFFILNIIAGLDDIDNKFTEAEFYQKGVKMCDNCSRGGGPVYIFRYYGSTYNMYCLMFILFIHGQSNVQFWFSVDGGYGYLMSLVLTNYFRQRPEGQFSWN